MELCVVSGKGGTGKTTVSVGLAVALGDPAHPLSVELVDCDVEAPNAHLYLRHSAPTEETVFAPVPLWASEHCTACGACAQACAFSALALLGRHLEVFSEHCHGCGACFRACPTGALTESKRRVGVVRHAEGSGVALRWGVLDVGEPRSTPLIQAARGDRTSGRHRILDGPPGTSCSLVAAAKGADVALLVTEPTPFGLHDLELAWQTVTLLGVPSAVAINRAQGGGTSVHAFCGVRGIPIVLEIPMDKGLAEAGARGIPLPVAEPAYRPILRSLWDRCEALAVPGRAS